MLEQKLATLIVERFPSIELVRFTNSGSEANLMALAAARAHTKRSKVMVFTGGYHGGLLSFGDVATLNAPFEFVIGKYNDIADARKLIKAHGDDIAAILVEPMQGASGSIPGDPAFLSYLRTAASRIHAVLVFDEVMTSRLSTGGRQLLLDITPDITTLGKYFGGGMSFGAFGGNAEIMSMFDPRRPKHLVHSGTFNNNVLSMAAGTAGLGTVLTPAALKTLNDRGDALRNKLNDLCALYDADMQFTGLGSLFNMHPTRTPVSCTDDIAGCDPAEIDLFYFHLLANDIFIARRGFIALTLPINDAHCERLIEVIDAYLRDGCVRRKARGS
jgi:glutamate-1-semialdehyde 2,1-aminomutase